jgi:hypothetical protein
LHETSINAGFTKDHENLVCEFHVTFKKQLFTHEKIFVIMIHVENLNFTYQKTPIAGSININEKVTFGDREQYIFMRGTDKSRPIMLFLHGGTGSPEVTFIEHYNSDFENDYVKVGNSGELIKLVFNSGIYTLGEKLNFMDSSMFSLEQLWLDGCYENKYLQPNL